MTTEKKTFKNKLLPLRMCSVCRKMKEKQELIRISLNKDQVFAVDNSYKMQGRGAYICKNNECIDRCVKKRLLNKGFKREVPKEIYEAICGYKTES